MLRKNSRSISSGQVARPCANSEPLATKHKGVSRIDQTHKHTHGWYVRVRLGGATKSRFFNDRKCGGHLAALQHAVEWRNQTEQELGKPRTDYVVVGANPRNNTGVVGVRRCDYKYVGKDGRVYLNPVYEVTWHANRDLKGKTSVSIKKYGEREVFRRACGIRRRKEQEMYGTAIVSKWAASLEKICAA